MILAKMHNAFGMLTETEKRIATFILQSPEKAMHMTAKEIASECKTAQSAVIRLCKSLGLDGFRMLKIELARETGRREKMPDFLEENGTEAVFRKVFASGIGTLRDTLRMLDFSQIEKMTDCFLRANRIFIFGVGTASPVAEDAAYRFSQMGLSAYAYTDVLFMHVAAGNMQKGDVALCISHSGRTKAVVEAMRHAKKAGAETIALTSFAESILAKESRYAVCVYADEENYPVEAVSARVAHICVIDAFMMAIGSKKYTDLEKYIAVRNQALQEIRYREGE